MPNLEYPQLDQKEHTGPRPVTVDIKENEAWSFELDTEPLAEIEEGKFLLGIIEDDDKQYALVRAVQQNELLVAEILGTGDDITQMKLGNGALIDLDAYDPSDEPNRNRLNLSTSAGSTTIARIGERVWVENASTDIKLSARNPVKMGGVTDNGEVAFTQNIFTNTSPEGNVAQKDTH